MNSPVRNRLSMASSMRAGLGASCALVLGVAILAAAPAAVCADPLVQNVSATDAPALPTAEEVYDAFFAAIGGKKAVENIDTAYTRLTVTTGGQVVPFTTHWHRDGAFLIEYTLGAAENRAGSDGETAWTFSPMRGYELMPKQTAKFVHQQSNFSTMLLTLDKQYDSMRVLSAETFHDRPAYRVALDGTGVPSRTAFFDRETGLVLGFTWSETSPIGDNQFEMLFSEWKVFGEIRMWTKLEINSFVREQSAVITTLEFNTMEPGVFDLPKEVKQLAEQSPPPVPEPPAPPVKVEGSVQN